MVVDHVAPALRPEHDRDHVGAEEFPAFLAAGLAPSALRLSSTSRMPTVIWVGRKSIIATVVKTGSTANGHFSSLLSGVANASPVMPAFVWYDRAQAANKYTLDHSAGSGGQYANDIKHLSGILSGAGGTSGHIWIDFDRLVARLAGCGRVFPRLTFQASYGVVGPSRPSARSRRSIYSARSFDESTRTGPPSAPDGRRAASPFGCRR